MNIWAIPLVSSYKTGSPNDYYQNGRYNQQNPFIVQYFSDFEPRIGNFRVALPSWLSSLL